MLVCHAVPWPEGDGPGEILDCAGMLAPPPPHPGSVVVRDCEVRVKLDGPGVVIAGLVLLALLPVGPSAVIPDLGIVRGQTDRPGEVGNRPFIIPVANKVESPEVPPLGIVGCLQDVPVESRNVLPQVDDTFEILARIVGQLSITPQLYDHVEIGYGSFVVLFRSVSDASVDVAGRVFWIKPQRLPKVGNRPVVFSHRTMGKSLP